MKKGYKLTKDAENDLRDVARYTLNTWGPNALEQYKHGIKETFSAIANDSLAKRRFSKKIPELLVTKYKSHFIFYLENIEGSAMIIGIIHEKRDILNHLSERLTG